MVDGLRMETLFQTVWVHNLALLYLSCISLVKLFNLSKLQLGEGNGTPLQYSGLENPMDGGAW